MANWLLVFDGSKDKGLKIYEELQGENHVYILQLTEYDLKKSTLSTGDAVYFWIGGDKLRNDGINGLYDKAMVTDINKDTDTYTFQSLAKEYKTLIFDEQIKPIQSQSLKDIIQKKQTFLSDNESQNISSEIDSITTSNSITNSENKTIEPLNNISDIEGNKKNSKNEPIQLEGILSFVLGEINRFGSKNLQEKVTSSQIERGVKVLRGFASYGLLKDFHTTDMSYQRKLNENHKISFIKYMESEQNFIPEIIYAFRSGDENKYLEQVTINSGYVNAQKMVINLNYWKLNIPSDAELYCIDGNHRVKAIEYLYEKNKELMVPFCIIFVPEKSNKEMFVFHEPSYFFNLNGRSEPLLPEQTFKYLTDNLKDKVNIEKSLSCYKFFEMLNKIDKLDCYKVVDKITYVSKKRIREIETEPPNGKKTIKEEYEESTENITYKEKIKATRVGELLFQVYKDNEDNIITDEKIVYSLTKIIEALCNDSQVSQQYIAKNCNDILPALVLYLYYKNETISIDIKDQIKDISKWLEVKRLTSDHFYSIEKLMLQYHQYISTKEINIFMAMPFNPGDKVDAMNIFKNEILIPEINNKFPNCSITFHEIMREKKEAREMWDDIREKIYNADIVISDLTDENINVIYELGIAYGRGKKLLVICDDKVEKIPFDMYQLYQIRYIDIEKKKFRDELKEKIFNIITDILNNNY